MTTTVSVAGGGAAVDRSPRATAAGSKVGRGTTAATAASLPSVTSSTQRHRSRSVSLALRQAREQRFLGAREKGAAAS